MPLSKEKNRERMRANRRSRLNVQLKLTPKVADYLESKAGNMGVGEYILGQVERAIQVARATQREG